MSQLRDFQRVGGMLLLPQRQGFQAQQELVRVERTQRRADVAQQRDADFQDERDIAQSGHVAQRIPVYQAVIARIRLGEFRELAVVPLEFAGIHDHAADAGAVAADVFGGGRGEDVRAVINRPHQADADGVVHDQRNAVFVRDLGKDLEVRHVELGIADRFDINGARFRRDGLAERLRVARVHELHRAAQLREGVMEKLVRAAVKIVARDNFIAQPRDGQQRIGDGRLAGSHAERAGAAFDGGHALLENIGRRIHQARVDVAEFFQREQIGRVFGVFEDVGGRLVDRHRARQRGGVGSLAGVQRQRANAFGLCAHNIGGSLVVDDIVELVESNYAGCENRLLMSSDSVLTSANSHVER